MSVDDSIAFQPPAAIRLRLGDVLQLRAVDEFRRSRDRAFAGKNLLQDVGFMLQFFQQQRERIRQLGSFEVFVDRCRRENFSLEGLAAGVTVLGQTLLVRLLVLGRHPHQRPRDAEQVRVKTSSRFEQHVPLEEIRMMLVRRSDTVPRIVRESVARRVDATKTQFHLRGLLRVEQSRVVQRLHLADRPLAAVLHAEQILLGSPSELLTVGRELLQQNLAATQQIQQPLEIERLAETSTHRPSATGSCEPDDPKRK